MLLPLLILPLVMTILIELGVLLLLRERRKKILISSVVVNILTNIPMNLYIAFLQEEFYEVLIAEMVVVIVETIWYFLFVKNIRQAFVYGFLCNAISMLTGILIELIYILLSGQNIIY